MKICYTQLIAKIVGQILKKMIYF